ncbi:hypothetical protein J6590_062343, partial [Homalodisca vitripennis]
QDEWYNRRANKEVHVISSGCLRLRDYICNHLRQAVIFQATSLHADSSITSGRFVVIYHRQ